MQTYATMRLLLTLTTVAITLSATASGKRTFGSAHAAITFDSSPTFCSGIEGAVDEVLSDELAAEQLGFTPTVQTFCILRYLEPSRITGQDETPEDVHH